MLLALILMLGCVLPSLCQTSVPATRPALSISSHGHSCCPHEQPKQEQTQTCCSVQPVAMVVQDVPTSDMSLAPLQNLPLFAVGLEGQQTPLTRSDSGIFPPPRLSVLRI